MLPIPIHAPIAVVTVGCVVSPCEAYFGMDISLSFRVCIVVVFFPNVVDAFSVFNSLLCSAVPHVHSLGPCTCLNKKILPSLVGMSNAYSYA